MSMLCFVSAKILGMMSIAYFKPRVKKAALKVSTRWESSSGFLLANAFEA